MPAICKAPPERFKTQLNVDLKNKILHLEAHCPYRQAGCDHTGKIRDMETHLRDQCQFVTIICSNGCSTKGLTRRDLNYHLMQCECAMVQCPFITVGCSGAMQRRYLARHLEMGTHRHLKKISDKTTAVSSSSEACLKQLRADYQAQNAAKEERIASLKVKIREMNATLATLEEQLRLAQRKARELQDEQERSMAHNTGDLIGKGCQIHRLRELYPAMEAQIEAMATPKSTKVVIPPVVFSINNFHERQRNDECWISPPFYTHCGGYKMCLGVYTNGSSNQKGKYLSVFVHFMEGEYDDYLQWPFEGHVTVVAVNQQNFVVGMASPSTTANHRGKIQLDKASDASRSRVVRGGYGPGWGYDKFIPLSDIGKYITLSGRLDLKILDILFLPL